MENWLLHFCFHFTRKDSSISLVMRDLHRYISTRSLSNNQIFRYQSRFACYWLKRIKQFHFYTIAHWCDSHSLPFPYIPLLIISNLIKTQSVSYHHTLSKESAWAAVTQQLVGTTVAIIPSQSFQRKRVSSGNTATRVYNHMYHTIILFPKKAREQR